MRPLMTKIAPAATPSARPPRRACTGWKHSVVMIKPGPQKSSSAMVHFVVPAPRLSVCHKNNTEWSKKIFVPIPILVPEQALGVYMHDASGLYLELRDLSLHLKRVKSLTYNGASTEERIVQCILMPACPGIHCKRLTAFDIAIASRLNAQHDKLCHPSPVSFV